MLDYILSHWDDLLFVATAVVTAASAITALTPTKDDDAVLSIVKKALDFLALNVGHAKKP
jgi:hypothetical protein